MDAVISFVIIIAALKSKSTIFQILAMGLIAILYTIELVYYIFKLRKEG